MLAIMLSIPSFDIHEIDAKTDGDQKVTGRLDECPAIARL
jgi:hypothetical protein